MDLISKKQTAFDRQSQHTRRINHCRRVWRRSHWGAVSIPGLRWGLHWGRRLRGCRPHKATHPSWNFSAIVAPRRERLSPGVCYTIVDSAKLPLFTERFSVNRLYVIVCWINTWFVCFYMILVYDVIDTIIELFIFDLFM